MDEQQAPIVTLTLDLNAVNFFLELLSARPYGEVVNLVNGIKQQVEPQLMFQQTQNEVAEPETTDNEG